MDRLLDLVEHGDVDLRTLLDLLDLLCIFYQIMGWNDVSLMCDLSNLIIKSFMADFVFYAAATPAGIVTVNFL